MTYIAGLDLGKTYDYSALSILDVQGNPPRVEVIWLKRWRGVDYPEIVRQVYDILHREPLWTNRYGFWDAPHWGKSLCPLVVDRTGVGLPVVDLFWEAGIRQMVAVFLHHGSQVRRVPSGRRLNFNVPKADTVAGVQVLVQNKRLRIAPALPEASTLTQELVNYRYKQNPLTAHESYAAAREADHDDTVASVALACWWGRHAGWHRARTWGR
jgi:hypothetical protein